MADEAQDKRLPASARKIEKSRAEGQVPRSRDLGHLAALGLGGALIASFAPELLSWLSGLLADGLRFDAASLARPGAMGAHLQAGVLRWLVTVLPFGALLSLVSVAAAVLSGGWNFTLQPLEPNFSKIDPFAGIARLFQPQQLVETVKVCLLGAIVGCIGWQYLRAELPAFAGLIALPLPAALAEAGSLLRGGAALMLLALAVFALVDVPLQRRMLLRRLRMTTEEAKQERKEVDGNAEVKAKMRAKMRSMASKRMLSRVPAADLVVMNPTHFAVALKYDEATMAAPRVVAKGSDLMAMRIRDAAKEHKVPVLQSPPLARALFRHAEVDQEIPGALFGAVAQVLAWVFQIRAAAANGRNLNLAPPDVVVPPGLDPAAEKA